MLVHGIPRFRAVLRAVLKRLADNDAQCLDELRFIFAQCRSVICAFTMLEIKILSFFSCVCRRCLHSRYLRNFLDNISRRTAEQFLPNVDNLAVLITLNDLVAVEPTKKVGNASSTGSDEEQVDDDNSPSQSRKRRHKRKGLCQFVNAESQMQALTLGCVGHV